MLDTCDDCSSRQWTMSANDGPDFESDGLPATLGDTDDDNDGVIPIHGGFRLAESRQPASDTDDVDLR